MRVAVASQDIGVVEATEEDQANGIPYYQFPGGSLWYRFLSPIEYNKRAGRITESVQGTLTRDRKRGLLGISRFDTGEDDFDFDVILLQRCVWPELADAIYLARSNGQVVINDMDDWFDGLPPDNNAFAAMKSNPLNHQLYRGILKASDGIVCSTPFLAGWYGRYAPTALWRNSVDFESFPEQHEHVDERRPTVGWFGSLNFRARDVEELSGIVGPYIERHDMVFVHMGADASDRRTVSGAAHIDPSRVIMLPAVSFIESSVELHKAFDIGLVPLQPIRFNEAKSALKGMEYTVSGIPFIASATPEYIRLRDLGCGRVARKAKDWQRHLDELQDPAVRRAEVERNAAVLREHHDIRNTCLDWFEIIKGWM